MSNPNPPAPRGRSVVRRSVAFVEHVLDHDESVTSADRAALSNLLWAARQWCDAPDPDAGSVFGIPTSTVRHQFELAQSLTGEADPNLAMLAALRRARDASGPSDRARIAEAQGMVAPESADVESAVLAPEAVAALDGLCAELEMPGVREGVDAVALFERAAGMVRAAKVADRVSTTARVRRERVANLFPADRTAEREAIVGQARRLALAMGDDPRSTPGAVMTAAAEWFEVNGPNLRARHRELVERVSGEPGREPVDATAHLQAERADRATVVEVARLFEISDASISELMEDESEAGGRSDGEAMASRRQRARRTLIVQHAEEAHAAWKAAPGLHGELDGLRAAVARLVGTGITPESGLAEVVDLVEQLRVMVAPGAASAVAVLYAARNRLSVLEEARPELERVGDRPERVTEEAAALARVAGCAPDLALATIMSTAHAALVEAQARQDAHRANMRDIGELVGVGPSADGSWDALAVRNAVAEVVGGSRGLSAESKATALHAMTALRDIARIVGVVLDSEPGSRDGEPLWASEIVEGVRAVAVRAKARTTVVATALLPGVGSRESRAVSQHVLHVEPGCPDANVDLTIPWGVLDGRFGPDRTTPTEALAEANADAQRAEDAEERAQAWARVADYARESSAGPITGAVVERMILTALDTDRAARRALVDWVTDEVDPDGAWEMGAEALAGVITALVRTAQGAEWSRAEMVRRARAAGIALTQSDILVPHSAGLMTVFEAALHGRRGGITGMDSGDGNGDGNGTGN